MTDVAFLSVPDAELNAKKDQLAADWLGRSEVQAILPSGDRFQLLYELLVRQTAEEKIDLKPEGLMGLLGFITIAAYFDKTRYPPRYFRQMIEAIVLVGVFGLVGFSFVDNAGHLGGLVSGLFLGWFFLKKNEQRIKEKKNLLELGGAAALLALGVISAIAVYRMMI